MSASLGDLQRLLPRCTLEYHRGPSLSGCPRPLTVRLRAMSELGEIDLVQRRNGCEDYSYLVQRRRHVEHQRRPWFNEGFSQWLQ